MALDIQDIYFALVMFPRRHNIKNKRKLKKKLNLFEGKDAFALLPTGLGKFYQLDVNICINNSLLRECQGMPDSQSEQIQNGCRQAFIVVILWPVLQYLLDKA